MSNILKAYDKLVCFEKQNYARTEWHCKWYCVTFLRRYQSTVLVPRYMYASHIVYSEEVHQSEVQFNDVHSCCCPHLFVFDKVDLINLIRIWWPLVCVHMSLSTVYFGPGFVENSSFLETTQNDYIWVRCLYFKLWKGIIIIIS